MQQNTTEIFRDAPVPKAVLSNVIPSIISMIMVLIYNLADTFFIGQTKNALMVAAVSVATPAFLLFMAVGMLFGIGGTSFISRMLGGRSGRTRKACLRVLLLDRAGCRNYIHDLNCNFCRTCLQSNRCKSGYNRLCNAVSPDRRHRNSISDIKQCIQ